jgi:hypothetical protein
MLNTILNSQSDRPVGLIHCRAVRTAGGKACG